MTVQRCSGNVNYWLLLVLVLAMQIIVAWSSVSHLHDSQVAEINSISKKNIFFLHGLIQDELQNKNYSTVESLLRKWGKSHSENIAKVVLTTKNGFTLGAYQWDSTPAHSLAIEEDILYSYRGTATLKLLVSLDSVYQRTTRIATIFAVVILVFTLLLVQMTRLYLRQKALTQALDSRSSALTKTVDNLKKQIAARTAAEEARAESELKYRSLMDNQNDAVFLHRVKADGISTFSEVNERAIRQYGYTREEFLRLSPLDISLPDDLQKHRASGHAQQLLEKGHLVYEIRHIKKTGQIFPVEISATVIEWQGDKYVLSAARDITERVQMQEKQQHLEKQLLHTQKLESLGVLAGGIAHDFNNILMAILGHSELAERGLAKGTPVTKNIRQIKLAAEKAAELTNQMLAYSGKGKFVIEPLDLTTIIQEMEYMLSVSISKKAVLRYKLDEQLPSVEADATQIRQIIMNLVINASDAIADKSGVISLSTGVMACDQNYLREAWLDENQPAGSYVFVEVTDNGCGMAPETTANIFDPFFTTKFTGRGLGMSAVLGIVRGHKGTIKVYSELGRGTTFKVLLPVSELPATSAVQAESTAPLQMTGLALVVDDEELLRELGKNMLELFGFTVLTAVDGREAVTVYKQHQTDIKLVLMDLTMPHMDGEEAFRELRRLDPNVKVIMSSGYNEQEVAQKFVGKGLLGFVQKPYQISALQNIMQKL
ncbi:MAG: response regulator [Desulfuromonadaceae bacterium]|nr:response regulator [Desulfuromonadaceae bacterium]